MPSPMLNACRLCGATNYRRVRTRNDNGALKPNGLYQCSGCSVVFTDPGAWRDGGPDVAPMTTGAKPLTPDQGPGPARLASPFGQKPPDPAV